MRDPIVEFTAHGSPATLSTTIEDHARDRRLVSALVVPWQSVDGALTMAITSVTSDGWAIEHTDLGSILLTDLGDDHTRISVSATDHPDRGALPSMLAQFADQLRQRLAPADGASA